MGLYYLQSRYYNPTLGRFLNADALVSTGQGVLGNNMFAYCRNNPVTRVDFSGTWDVDCFDSDGNPITDEKDQWGRSSCGGCGGSSTTGENSGGGNGKGIPQNAYDILNYVKGHNGSPPKGYKGGQVFQNDGRNGGDVLPNKYAPFYEYDIYPKVAGQSRGMERIIIGNGAAWYTCDHYMTFIQME